MADIPLYWKKEGRRNAEEQEGGVRPNGRFVRVQFSTHWAETDLKNAAQQLIAVKSY